MLIKTGRFSSADNLKNRYRLAISGIWKPHCQPEATLRNSVGTLGLLLKELTDGQFETTCCTSGYATLA